MAQQAPAELDTIKVQGMEVRTDALAGSVTSLKGETLRDGQRQVNLSESLQRVPGLTAFDRQNYAQDLQSQSRGFGARSTFGIRGIRLIVDGIPATAADGQGQAAAFPLSSLDRIDVLRGPLALQYGNAAGGVIVGRSQLVAEDRLDADVWAGGHGSGRASVRTDLASASGAWRARIAASVFATDGLRAQSAARRQQANAIAAWSPTQQDRLQLVANLLRQPLAEDPLGLSRADFDRDPDGADPVASRFDTRKRIGEDQLGLRWERDRDDGGMWLGVYRIEREVGQFLAVPVAAQRAPGSAGGVIDLHRASHGFEGGWRHDVDRGAVAFGIDAAWLGERRRGYENFVGDSAAPSRLGVRGRLRRNERNRLESLDLWLSADYAFAEDWTLSASLRRSRWRIDSRDDYIAPGNGDDSGRMRDSATAFALGATGALEHGEVYVAVGAGFESPTITELAYRPDGASGLNRDLRRARVTSSEAGWRWRGTTHEGSLALYRIDSRDEIVPAGNSGGRASFANAGRTRREGVEFGFSGTLSGGWRYALAAAWIDARFVEAFSFASQGEVRRVDAGNRIPGVPRTDLFAELDWRSDDGRWSHAIEAHMVGRIVVDDRNTDAAAGSLRLAWRGQWRAARGGWRAFARIDNLVDRRYAGSVIVNEGNGRFFEPAAGRTLTLGLGWSGTR